MLTFSHKNTRVNRVEGFSEINLEKQIYLIKIARLIFVNIYSGYGIDSG